MSLLNDALRKKRSEQQTDGPLIATRPKLSTKDGVTTRKRIRIAIAGVLLAALASCGAWLYWLASDGPGGTKQSASSVAAATLMEDSASMKTIGRPAVESASPRSTPAAATDLTAAPSTPTPSRQAHIEKQVPVATSLPTTPQSPSKGRIATRPETPAPVSRPRPKKPIQPPPKARRQRAARSGDVQRQEQSERLYQKARQYHRRDHLEQAIALYQEVIKIDPQHDNARFNLGAAYLQTGSFENAYSIMADLYLKEPDNHQVMLNLAVANIGLHRFDQALVLLDKAAATPKAPLFEIALHKGIAYNRLNQIQDALEWYRRAEAIRPDDPRLLFNLAVACDQQQRYTAAIDYYQRHIDQSPGMNADKKKQIRRRIRLLQAYRARPNPEESTQR